MEFLSVDNQLIVYWNSGPDNSNSRLLRKRIHERKGKYAYYLEEISNTHFLCLLGWRG